MHLHDDSETLSIAFLTHAPLIFQPLNRSHIIAAIPASNNIHTWWKHYCSVICSRLVQVWAVFPALPFQMISFNSGNRQLRSISSPYGIEITLVVGESVRVSASVHALRDLIVINGTDFESLLIFFLDLNDLISIKAARDVFLFNNTPTDIELSNNLFLAN